MELVWATEDLLMAGRPYPGFPILLWDTMESCVPVNDFIRTCCTEKLNPGNRGQARGAQCMTFSVFSRRTTLTGAM